MRMQQCGSAPTRQAWGAQQKLRRPGRAPAVRPTASSEHAHYVCEVAVVAGTPKVEALVRVLEAQGQSIVAPGNRGGLHPLLIPLSQQQQEQDGSSSSGGGSSERVTCLLRWPEGHRGMELPVVSMERRGTQVQLLARSADEYLLRALAEEESSSGSSAQAGPVAEAAGPEGRALYEAGSYERSGTPSLGVFLTKQKCLFPDVAEALALAHLERGDSMSALITGEWYMRNSHFPGWGRPYEFNTELLQRMGRGEEGRDVARIALRMPWWTFAAQFTALRDVAGLSGGIAEVRRAFDAQDDMSNMPGMRTAVKTDKQQQLDEAEWLLNSAAAGEAAWDDIREPLAARYREAGLPAVADFVVA